MATRSKAANRTRRTAASPRRGRGRLAPGKASRGLDAADVAIALDNADIGALVALVRDAGGAPIGAYREPLGGRALLLASLPLGRPFMRLILTLDQGELAIFVRDYCPGAPQPGNANDEDENGRGLQLVEAMSSRSGWHAPEDGTSGKVVWAALSS